MEISNSAKLSNKTGGSQKDKGLEESLRDKDSSLVDQLLSSKEKQNYLREESKLQDNLGIQHLTKDTGNRNTDTTSGHRIQIDSRSIGENQQ